MWSRLGAVIALSAGMLVTTAAAQAEDPIDLGGAYVLDTTGAITGDWAAEDISDSGMMGIITAN